MPRVRVSRRQFLVGAAIASAHLAARRLEATVTGGVPPSIRATATQIVERRISVTDAVKRCLARIEEVNPELNAIVALCAERALQEAKEADAMLAAGKTKGVLHGVPFTVSDSLDTVGVVSAAGTLGRKDHIPSTDATIVARARGAGAILLGKTNVSELSLAPGAHGARNVLHGSTKNPYAPLVPARGAAAGGAAIVAADASCFDLAAGFSGALRESALAMGIAGFKPTLGRLPRTGHCVGPGGPFDAWLDAGFFTRHADDLSLLLPVLCGPDGVDTAMCPVPLGEPSQVTMRGMRVACFTDGDDAVKSAIGHLRSLGCETEEDRPPELEQLASARSAYRGADGRAYVQRLLTRHGTLQASPDLQQGGTVLPSAEFSRLCELIDAIRSRQLQWFERYDLLICPAVPDPPGAEPGPLDLGLTGWPAGIARSGGAAVQVVAPPWRDHVALAALAHIDGRQGS